MSACLATCTAVMVAIVRSDLATRTIPRELCWILGAVGLAFQAFRGGWHSITIGLLYAIAVCMVCAIGAAMMMRRNGSSGIGGGDVRCMMALCCLCADGSYAGSLACFMTALAVNGIRRLKGRLMPGEPFAFAPYLALWAIVGLAVCFA